MFKQEFQSQLELNNEKEYKLILCNLIKLLFKNDNIRNTLLQSNFKYLVQISQYTSIIQKELMNIIMHNTNNNIKIYVLNICYRLVIYATENCQNNNTIGKKLLDIE